MNSNTPPITFPADTLLDQSANQGMAPPGTLRRLENLEKTGANGALTKRPGYKRTDSNAFTDPVRCFGHKGDTIIVNPAVVQVANSTHQIFLGIERAPSLRLAASRSVIGDSSTDVRNAGCASVGGYRLWVWRQERAGSAEVWIAIYSETTNELALAPRLWSTSGTAAEAPRVIAVDDTFVITWVEMGSTRIRIRTVTPQDALANFSLGTVASLVTDVRSGFYTYDMANGGTTASPQFVLVYDYDDTVNTGIKAITASKDGTIDDTYSTTGGESGAACASATDDSDIWLLSSIGTNLQPVLYLLDSDLTLQDSASVMTANDVQATGALLRLTSTSIVLAGSNSNDSDGVTVARRFFNASGTVDGTTDPDTITVRGIMSCKPFLAESRVFVALEINGKQDSGGTRAENLPYAATVVAALPIGEEQALADPNLILAYGRTFWGLYASVLGFAPKELVPPAVSDNGTEIVFPIIVRVSEESDPSVVDTRLSQQSTGLAEYRLRVTKGVDSPACVASEAGGVTVTSGGCAVYQWDGGIFSELGFAEFPFPDGGTQTTGGSIEDGTYAYAFTYEYTDHAGRRHQSAPSFARDTETFTTNNAIDFVVDAARLHAKLHPFDDDSDRVRVVMWRTLDGPGGIYYRVTSAANDSTTGTVTLSDTSTDDTIAKNEPLYVSAGELAHVPPPASRHVVAYQNRLAGIDAEYPHRVWFTKRARQDQGFAYNPALQTWCYGIGELTALAELNGTLYAFSESGCMVVAYGDGPDNAGGGAWPQANKVFEGVGCVDCRGIVTCADGILFASGADGRTRLWITSGGPPVEVGAKVRLELDAHPIVTSAANDASRSYVYVTAVNSSTDASVVLVYDYGNRGPDGQGVWYVWKSDSVDDIRSSCVVNGEHWTASGGGEVHYLDSSLYVDGGNGFASYWVTYAVETQDIRSGNLSPFGRVNAVVTGYEYVDVGKVQLQISTDGGESFGTAYTDAITADPGVQFFPRYVEPALKRLYSAVGFRLKWTDASPDGGTTLDSASSVPRTVTIDYLPLPGTLRPASGERMAQ